MPAASAIDARQVKPTISVVIAAYNEAVTLRSVFDRCFTVLQQCADEYEIIILDDASTDTTRDVAEAIREEHPSFVHLLTHDVNRGIAVTFEELYAAASKDYIFDVPADGEYPPEALVDILPLLDEYEMVVCHRVSKQYTIYRRIVSYLYRALPRIMFGVELYDPGSTKCRSRRIIQEITITSSGVFAEAERLIRALRRGNRLAKVDVVPQRRLAGDPQGAKLSNVMSAAVDLCCLWVRLILLRQPA